MKKGRSVIQLQCECDEAKKTIQDRNWSIWFRGPSEKRYGPNASTTLNYKFTMVTCLSCHSYVTKKGGNIPILRELQVADLDGVQWNYLKQHKYEKGIWYKACPECLGPGKGIGCIIVGGKKIDCPGRCDRGYFRAKHPFLG